MSKTKYYLLSLTILLFTVSCFTITYSSKGGDIGNIETVSVQYFDNRAPRIEPTLSQKFTDALKEYLEDNTKLRVVNTIGDVDFSGSITNYDIKATAIGAGDLAAKTRFTITIKVKYTHSLDPDKSFESSFSRYRDFDSTTEFSSVEASLTDEILEEILEQIYNKAFVNW